MATVLDRATETLMGRPEKQMIIGNKEFGFFVKILKEDAHNFTGQDRFEVKSWSDYLGPERREAVVTELSALQKGELSDAVVELLDIKYPEDEQATVESESTILSYSDKLKERGSNFISGTNPEYKAGQVIRVEGGESRFVIQDPNSDNGLIVAPVSALSSEHFAEFINENRRLNSVEDSTNTKDQIITDPVVDRRVELISQFHEYGVEAFRRATSYKQPNSEDRILMKAILQENGIDVSEDIGEAGRYSVLTRKLGSVPENIREMATRGVKQLSRQGRVVGSKIANAAENSSLALSPKIARGNAKIRSMANTFMTSEDWLGGVPTIGRSIVNLAKSPIDKFNEDIDRRAREHQHKMAHVMSRTINSNSQWIAEQEQGNLDFGTYMVDVDVEYLDAVQERVEIIVQKLNGISYEDVEHITNILAVEEGVVSSLEQRIAEAEDFGMKEAFNQQLEIARENLQGIRIEAEATRQARRINPSEDALSEEDEESIYTIVSNKDKQDDSNLQNSDVLSRLSELKVMMAKGIQKVGGTSLYANGLGLNDALLEYRTLKEQLRLMEVGYGLTESAKEAERRIVGNVREGGSYKYNLEDTGWRQEELEIAKDIAKVEARYGEGARAANMNVYDFATKAATTFWKAPHENEHDSVLITRLDGLNRALKTRDESSVDTEQMKIVRDSILEILARRKGDIDNQSTIENLMAAE